MHLIGVALEYQRLMKTSPFGLRSLYRGNIIYWDNLFLNRRHTEGADLGEPVNRKV
jgi:hypothetical protein